MIKIVAIFLLALMAIDSAQSAASWSYGGSDGPSTWGSNFAECAASNQSPIDIQHSGSLVDGRLGNFALSMFTAVPPTMQLLNNGHAYITGGYTISDSKVLPGNYQALQFHLHWAANGSTVGSEHFLDNKQYFGELHIVHVNTKYPNISVALGETDGLAVLGFFVKVISTADNSAMEVFMAQNRLQAVAFEDATSNQVPFALSTIFPADFSNYYRYQGSLTTPPCSEAVVWTVFREPIIISQAQVIDFSLYQNKQNAPPNLLIGGNYRPTLPLNGRVVTRPSSELKLKPLTHTGPENWLNSYDACGTMSQSPIDIVHGATVADEKLGKFNRTTFTAIPDKMTLLNNGHALQVNLEGGYTVSDRNVLPGDYQAFQFHLHWAAVNQSRGSEHWIDGKQYFAELHIVHYNTKYASIGEALTQHEGLAVLGVFVAIGSETNENIDLLLNPIAQIQQYNQQMIYSSKFDIGRFLPEDLENYYRYSGSLTTPPCFESVVWTVFNEPIYISRAQVI
uniref:Carbonic anhydrase n=1 Tax=Ciona savignyi TaxID=51511 RepID=H2YZZ6_CIOSA